MANYKCRAYGDCRYATSGEIFVRGPGDDLRCPGGCETMLELDGSPTGPIGGPKTDRKYRGAAVVAGVVALLLCGAGGAYYYVQNQQENQQVQQPIVPPGKGGIAPSDTQIDALRNASAMRLTHGDAAGAEAASNDAAAKEMIKVAIADMQQGKLADAEQALSNARARDSNQPLVYYNLCVLRLRQGRTDDALKELRTSFEYGFREFDAMAKDPDFSRIRNDPRFVALLKQYHPATT